MKLKKRRKMENDRYETSVKRKMSQHSREDKEHDKRGQSDGED